MTVTTNEVPDGDSDEIPDEELNDGEDVTAPNNLDALQAEMVVTINLYLEALARFDSENEDDTPRLIPVDWAVVMTGVSETGDAETYYYRMDASGAPHTQVGLARVLSLALES